MSLKLPSPMKLPHMEPPKFEGDVVEFPGPFRRWARMTGIGGVPDLVQVDWIVQHAGVSYRPLLEKMAKGVETLEGFL